MDEGFGCEVGGILGLFGVLTDHPDEAEYQLLTVTGFTSADIGAGRLSWGDVRLVFRFAGPGSPLFRAVHGHGWDEHMVIAKAIHDQLAVANVQRTGKRGLKPKLYPLPKPLDDRAKGARHIGTAAPADKVRAWLERRNGR